jgi:four helix bundle protein
MAFKFDQLKVFQKSLDLSELVQTLIKRFPKDELFVLVPQIKRASDSIALNIAEGSTGQSPKEFSRFLNYSIRSGIEVISCLHLAKRRNLINEEEFKNAYHETESLIIKIQALRNSIRQMAGKHPGRAEG